MKKNKDEASREYLVVETHIQGKSSYSYATLITYAVTNSPNKQLMLNEIYNWVMENYPYYKDRWYWMKG
jgi:hypothetical protein